MRKKPGYREFRGMTISEVFYKVKISRKGQDLTAHFQMRSDGAVLVNSKPITQCTDNTKVYKFKDNHLYILGSGYGLERKKTKDGLQVWIVARNFGRNISDKDRVIFLNELDVKMIRMGRDSFIRRKYIGKSNDKS